MRRLKAMLNKAAKRFAALAKVEEHHANAYKRELVRVRAAVQAPAKAQAPAEAPAPFQA
jgi:hypothetical protein